MNKTKIILSDDKEVIVHKFKVKQLRVISKFLASLPEDMNLTFEEDENTFMFIKRFSGLVSENFDDILDLIAQSTNLDSNTLEDVALDDIYYILKTIYEVNKDFLGKFLKVEEEIES
ncbi:MAG: hypothetical protein AB7E09_07250 [Candidatus Izemoplasmatales bacterium]